jgi:hypothetical protein
MFVPGKPLKPRLMFVGKGEAYTSESPLRCSFLELALGLTNKIKLVKDAHSSLL